MTSPPGLAATRDRRPLPAPPPSGGIEVSRLDSLTAARVLAPEWAALAENAGGRSPFTHPGWLLSWAEHFLLPGEDIWLLTARRNGRLVGVAPFYRRTWGPGLAHSMQLWGTGRHNDLVELPQLLLGRGQPRAVARALVSHLCAGSQAWDWAEVSLPDSLWLEPDWLPRGGKMTVLTKTVRATVVLPLDPARPLVTKRNLRESLRRARNRLDRSFPGEWSVRCASEGAELAAALSDLVRLHEERSQLTGKKRHRSALTRPADRSFLAAGVTALAPHGGAAVYLLTVHGETAAALLTLRGSGCTYFLLSGMSERSWEFSPITLLQGRAVDDAIMLGHQWVNLSTGPDTAKLRWSEQLAMSTEFVLVPDRPFARAAFGVFWQASAAAAIRRERLRHKPLGTGSAGPPTWT